MEPGDGPALAALERASPETGRLVVQIEPRIGYLELVARYSGVRGYVAQSPDAAGIVGMLFSSVAPTQLNGAVAPGAYLFSLRVHPTARRRGLGSALIAHAWDRARAEAGAELAWAAVMAGNDASLRIFARAGFARLRDAAIHVGLPSFRPARRDAAWALRPATRDDLPGLAEVLNRAHAAHNFWRLCTAESLAKELIAARHTLHDVKLVEGRDGRILAAAAVFDLNRVFHLRPLGHRDLPAPLNRKLAPLLFHLPLRPLVLRYRALAAAHADAGLSLLRSIHRQTFFPLSVLATPLDPLDPAWPLLAQTATLARPLHLVVRSATPVDQSRPAVVL